MLVQHSDGQFSPRSRYAPALINCLDPVLTGDTISQGCRCISSKELCPTHTDTVVVFCALLAVSVLVRHSSLLDIHGQPCEIVSLVSTGSRHLVQTVSIDKCKSCTQRWFSPAHLTLTFVTHTHTHTHTHLKS